MTIDDIANNLRDQVIGSGKAAETMVQDLEDKRRSGHFGHISTSVHAGVIEQYRQSARQLLSMSPGDNVALSALEHAEELVTRVSKAALPSTQG